MTKNEHSRLTLKGKALDGLEKFNIPKTASVEYEVTLLSFEKVCQVICRRTVNIRLFCREKNRGQ